MSDTCHSFKDLTGLTTGVKWFIYAQVIISIIIIILNFLEYQSFINFEFTITAKVKLTWQDIILNSQALVYLISAVLILRWIYFANYNVHQLGAKNMNFTPGWAIAWYFIPIANLWKPYQAMKEIWQTSVHPQSWQTQSSTSLISWWWFLWIINHSLIGNVAVNFMMDSAELNDSQAIIILEILNIILSLILLTIIKKIYHMQMRHKNIVIPQSVVI